MSVTGNKTVINRCTPLTALPHIDTAGLCCEEKNVIWHTKTSFWIFLRGWCSFSLIFLGVEVNVFASLSPRFDHSSVVTPALNGLTAMNIRYTSLHPTGQIWWASLTRLCRDKHSAVWVSVWASEIKKLDCGCNIMHEWRQICLHAHADTYISSKKYL